jgi:hypothetical protein
MVLMRLYLSSFEALLFLHLLLFRFIISALLRVSTEYRLGDRMEETIGDERPLGDAIA